MSRSVKKGPYVEPALMKRITEMNASGKKAVVTFQHDLPGLCGPYRCCA